jgi:hypothetical protein
MTNEQRVREVVDAYLARMSQDLEVRALALTKDLIGLITDQEARHARDLAELQQQAAAAPLISPSPPAPDGSTREARVETMERLLGSVRRIDESSSLNAILGALARGAAAETSRVAILLVDGYMFRTWGNFGFAEGTGPTEMPIGTSGTLAAAVALKQTCFVPPVIDGRDGDGAAFMRVPAGHTGLVVPLTVGGEVVAVLYADDMARSVEHEDAPLWTEELELLARHASIRLENITSARTVEVLARAD